MMSVHAAGRALAFVSAMLICMPSLAASTTELVKDRIRLSVSGAWAPAAGSFPPNVRMWAPAGKKDPLVVMLDAVPLEARTMVELLDDLLDRLNHGRTQIEIDPTVPIVGVHPGLKRRMVAQARHTRSADGEDWYGLYVLLEVSPGRAQLLALIGTDEKGFEAEVDRFFSALKTATFASGPPAEEPATPEPGGAPSSPTGTTGASSPTQAPRVADAGDYAAPGDTSVWDRRVGGGTGHIARMRPGRKAKTVSYRVERHPKALGLGHTFRDRHGDLFHRGQYKVSLTTSSGQTRVIIPYKRLLNDVIRLKGRSYRTNTEIEEMEVDHDGNVYLELDGDSGKGWNVFIVYRRDTGWQRGEAIASQAQIGELAMKHSHYRGSGANMNVAPDGSIVWIVCDGKSGTKLGYALRDPAAGRWVLGRALSWARPANGLEPKVNHSILSGAAPDQSHGFVFYSRGHFWWVGFPQRPRPGLEMALTMRPLVKVGLPGKGVWWSNHVVLPNGDIWTSFNKELKGGSIGTPSNAVTWVNAGGRSRWLRIRFTDGEATVAEIDGQHLLKSLRKAGHRNKSGVFKSTGLRPDHASGGILAFDRHHTAVYSVLPRD